MTGTARRRLLAAVVAAGAALTTGGLLSGAFFTDSASIDNNNFAFGTLDIATSPTGATPLFTLNPANPGDQWTGQLTVSNPGSMDLRYALESATTENALAGALELKIQSGMTPAECTTANMRLRFGMPGVTEYDGPLGSTAGLPVLGDKTQGAQAGDRTLAAGTSEMLCVYVAAPTNMDNTHQGQSTSAQLNFYAEQVANNP